MLAAKRGNSVTARVMLEFGIDPAILLLKDADGSTLLHIAVQKADTVLAELLLKYGPTQLLYTENSVGQTPLDIASLKGLPRTTGLVVPKPTELPMGIENHLRTSGSVPPFDVNKQKAEIPKLRATLDTLLAEGRLASGTDVTTELLAFASRMEGKLAVETAQKNAAEKQAEELEKQAEELEIQAEELEFDPVAPQGTTARTYFVLRDAAAARPGRRQLVHLADVQRSVGRNLAEQVEGTLVRMSERKRATDEENKEADPEAVCIAELKARSLFRSLSVFMFNPRRVDLYGEDKF